MISSFKKPYLKLYKPGLTLQSLGMRMPVSFLSVMPLRSCKHQLDKQKVCAADQAAREWEGIRLMTDVSCLYQLRSVSTN